MLPAHLSMVQIPANLRVEFVAMNTYLIISDGKIIREYSDLSNALWDLDFLRLMYPDPEIYKRITEGSNNNGSETPGPAQSD